MICPPNQGKSHISNEYFGLDSQLDESFETFWNSAWSYSPKELGSYRAKDDDLGDFRSKTREWLADAGRLDDLLVSSRYEMILFDNDKLVVGSLNLDPRSKYLNTEIALLIRSKELAP